MNSQLEYTRHRHRVPPDFHNLKPCFDKDLPKFVFRPLLCRSHNPHLHVYRRLETCGSATWHHDIVDQKLTVSGYHCVSDMTEDREDIFLVVPVMQDAVQIVSARTSYRLRLEKIVWDPSDPAVACRGSEDRGHIFEKQLRLVAWVCQFETLQIITSTASYVYQQRSFLIAFDDL